MHCCLVRSTYCDCLVGIDCTMGSVAVAVFNRIDFEGRVKQSAGYLGLDMDLRIKTPFEQMIPMETDGIGRCVMPMKQHRHAYSVDGTGMKAGDRKPVENNRNLLPLNLSSEHETDGTISHQTQFTIEETNGE